MSFCDLAPDYIRSIAPYIPGKPVSELAREMGLAEDRIVKLASNENPLGVSPKARAAIEAVLPELARYPDGNGFALKSRIAEKFGVALEQIVLGNGSNDVLDMIARAFLSVTSSSVYSQYCFAVYPLATQAVGARGIEVPAVAFGHDLTSMRDAIDADTRVVWIANPNNPTGTLLPPDEVLAFLEDCPREVIIVLDEAYTEYLEPALRADIGHWLKRFPNLVVVRTFSKAYGLAGLRVGFALTSAPVADMLNRVRQPFNVNSLALVAAEAALGDQAFLDATVHVNHQGYRQLTEAFERLSIDYIPSYGNFVTFKATDAAGLNRFLLANGVIIRPIGNYGLGDYLRVSIGSASENARFIEVLEEALTA